MKLSIFHHLSKLLKVHFCRHPWLNYLWGCDKTSFWYIRGKLLQELDLELKKCAFPFEALCSQNRKISWNKPFKHVLLFQVEPKSASPVDVSTLIPWFLFFPLKFTSFCHFSRAMHVPSFVPRKPWPSIPSMLLQNCKSSISSSHG